MKKRFNEWGPPSKAAKVEVRQKKKRYCKCLEQKKIPGKYTIALGKNVNWYFEICLAASKKWSKWPTDKMSCSQCQDDKSSHFSGLKLHSL